ncbi:MAG TPA: hypothetical protein VFZ65_00925 [Planctomycetota bacterium]|nr:hypothetical protein [Planctomycetota bacterium]
MQRQHSAVQNLDTRDAATPPPRIRLGVDVELDGMRAEIDVARTSLPHYVVVRLGNGRRRIDLRADDAPAAGQLLELCFRALAGEDHGFFIDASSR